MIAIILTLYLINPLPNYVLYGPVTLTSYCACKKCCGPSAPNKTASNKWPKEGRTVAGPRSIPLNTKIKIWPLLDLDTVVEDRLALRYDKRFDFYVEDHNLAVKIGKQERIVYVKR